MVSTTERTCLIPGLFSCFLFFVLSYRSCFAGWFTVGVFFVFGTGSLVPAHLLFLYAMHNFFPGFSSLLFSYLHSVHAWCIRRVFFCSTVSQLGDRKSVV